MLAQPSLYHYMRQVLTGGLPLEKWARLAGLQDGSQRIADIGCGAADVLRRVGPGGRPAFYLGLDESELYLGAARKRARERGVSAEFLARDLSRLPVDANERQALVDVLERHQVNRVLLLGVLHHLDDPSARYVLSTVQRAKSVTSVFTQDVLFLPGPSLNNWFAARDRGAFVRNEASYDSLVAGNGWDKVEKVWTSSGHRCIRFLHYRLERSQPG